MTPQIKIQGALDQAIVEAGAGGNCVVLLVDRGNEFLVERGIHNAAATPMEQYYQLGSLSKFITAAACLSLGEQGVLGLDDPLQFAEHLIPRYLSQRVAITPRQILHHITGLNVRSVPGYPRDEDIPTLAEVIAGQGRSPALAFTGIPMGRVVYSSGAFTLLQAELEESHDLPGLLLDAIRNISPSATILAESPTGPESTLTAKGFIHSAIPVPHGSLHYPEICAGGLWARPQDLMSLLIDIAPHLRGAGSNNTVSSRIRNELLSLHLHPKMAMSVLVDEDRDGRTYYHHQGASAGFTTEFVSYPHEDVHIVAMASAAVTPPELRTVVKQALAASSVSPSTAPMPGVLPESTPSTESHTEAVGTYAGDSLEAEVAAEIVTVRTRSGFELELRRTAPYLYSVPGEPYPRCVIEGERLRFSDGSRLYRLNRSPSSKQKDRWLRCPTPSC
ncbi:serine hydrolase domain-containing protein [Streptomyces sp. NPDC001407]|uniref:serine hydrolase domain-containing protein n=1 Tax=Streptomyces sp. NPDC001407 TaxID=3364573 RepID=UPI003681D756